MRRRLAAIAVAGVALIPGKADAHHSTRHTICQVFRDRCAQATWIVRCESNFNPRAVGRAGEKGLTQVHPIWFGRVIRSRAGSIYVNPRRLFEPRYNLRVAWVLSSGGTNWRPWTCSRLR